ncbi:hypothetical protein KKG41_04100 [Patescibacteria group bacterium]|nr:hypothetical protein [Patescibacteria group bacterium]MBU1891138.1 hypothetical protein [Patescibacteria group bacterium]
MKKYILAHEEHAITPLTISPNHNGWAAKTLIKLLDGHKTGINTFIVHEDKGLIYYCDKDAWDKGSDYLISKIQANPKFIKSIKKKSEEFYSKSLKIVRQTEKQDLKKWSNKKLAGFLLKTYDLALEYSAYGYVPVLSDHYFNKYSHLLKRIVKGSLENKNVTLSVPETVNHLSTPTKLIPSQLARLELLKLALGKKDAVNIRNYYQKWFWVNYGHLGPRITLSETIDAIDKLSKNKRKTKKELEDLLNLNSATIKIQKQLFKKLSLSPIEKYLFRVAQTFTYLKGQRMESLFGIYAQWERVLSVVSARWATPKKLLYYCSVNELNDLIRKNKTIPLHVLKSREEFCVWVARSEYSQQILIGPKAKQYIKKHARVSRQKIKDVLVIHGNVASTGYAKGRVKIVNRTSEVSKVEPGDVLVSVATNPSLLPAMKIASAFVTDTGGLTSHAAIVAREFKKPCIISTKIATKVLNDGDMVEVDAKKGDVKKV